MYKIFQSADYRCIYSYDDNDDEATGERGLVVLYTLPLHERMADIWSRRNNKHNKTKSEYKRCNKKPIIIEKPILLQIWN